MSTLPASDSPDAPPEEQRERLSLTQVAASALATVTATAALSLFGVAGTVVGAALASVLTVVGNHLYAQSIKRTQAHVLAGTSALRTRAAVVVGDPHRFSGHADRAVADPAVQDRTGRRVLDLGSRKRLLLTTLAVFVAILAAVTAFELLAGKPLSDVIRGQGGSGTSIGTHVDSPAPGTSTSTGTTTPSGSSGTSTTSSSTSTTSTGSSSGSSSSTDVQTSASPTSSTAGSTSSTTAPPTSQSSTTGTPTGASSSSSATGAG